MKNDFFFVGSSRCRGLKTGTADTDSEESDAILALLLLLIAFI